MRGYRRASCRLALMCGFCSPGNNTVRSVAVKAQTPSSVQLADLIPGMEYKLWVFPKLSGPKENSYITFTTSSGEMGFSPAVWCVPQTFHSILSFSACVLYLLAGGVSSRWCMGPGSFTLHRCCVLSALIIELCHGAMTSVVSDKVISVASRVRPITEWGWFERRNLMMRGESMCVSSRGYACSLKAACCEGSCSRWPFAPSLVCRFSWCLWLWRSKMSVYFFYAGDCNNGCSDVHDKMRMRADARGLWCLKVAHRESHMART